MCIFWDSITNWALDVKNWWWANLIRRHYLEICSTDEIYVLWIDWDTSLWLVKRMNLELEARIILWPIDKIIIAIWDNDSIYFDSKDNPYTPIWDFKDNLRKLYNIANKFTNEITFIWLLRVDESKTMPTPWSIGQKNLFYDNENLELYDNEIKKFCNDNKIKYIYMADCVSIDELEDWLHPDSVGHMKMFERIYNI